MESFYAQAREDEIKKEIEEKEKEKLKDAEFEEEAKRQAATDEKLGQMIGSDSVQVNLPLNSIEDGTIRMPSIEDPITGL